MFVQAIHVGLLSGDPEQASWAGQDGKNRAPTASIAELAAASRVAVRQSQLEFGLFCAPDDHRIVAIACIKQNRTVAAEMKS
jgi:hypothetical protein